MENDAEGIPGITPRMARIFECVRVSILTTGVAPTLREIGCKVSIAKSQVYRALQALERCGYIRGEYRKQRAIVLLRYAPLELDKRTIAAMDAFARDWSQGKVGSLNDYMAALQRIVGAGAVA